MTLEVSSGESLCGVVAVTSAVIDLPIVAGFMSTMTRVFRVSDVPRVSATRPKASLGVADVSRRPPVSTSLVSNSVSHCVSWPAAF